MNQNKLANTRVEKLFAVQAYYKSKNIKNIDFESVPSDSEDSIIIDLEIDSDIQQSLM